MICSVCCARARARAHDNAGGNRAGRRRRRKKRRALPARPSDLLRAFFFFFGRSVGRRSARARGATPPRHHPIKSHAVFPPRLFRCGFSVACPAMGSYSSAVAPSVRSHWRPSASPFVAGFFPTFFFPRAGRRSLSLGLGLGFGARGGPPAPRARARSPARQPPPISHQLKPLHPTQTSQHYFITVHCSRTMGTST